MFFLKDPGVLYVSYVSHSIHAWYIYIYSTTKINRINVGKNTGPNGWYGHGMRWIRVCFTLLNTIKDAALKLLHPTTPNFHSSHLSGETEALKHKKHRWLFLTKPRWWFQICFIFTPIWGRFPSWLIFFKGVETTNQQTYDHMILIRSY